MAVAHVFRFFLPIDAEAVTIGGTVCLAPDDAKRAAKVLRLAAGETVEIADGRGRVFLGNVANARAGEVVLTQELPGQHPLVPIRVLLAQSGTRADDAVEKLVELGVAEIAPLLARGRRRDPRTDRWQRIAEAAAAQAKLAQVPTISAPVAYDVALEAGAIVCSHERDDTSLTAALAASDRPITLLIGPEAGFTEGELDAARQAGVPVVRIGHTVLRTETAAVVVAALVIDRLSSL